MPLTVSCNWEMRRVIWALTYRKCQPVDIAHYAAVFDLDEEETLGLFLSGAQTLGIPLTLLDTESVRH